VAKGSIIIEINILKGENNMSNVNDEKLFRETAGDTVSKIKLAGMRAGATGILGAVLNMCNEGKSVTDIKSFCEKSLNLEGLKGDK
jgi:hypothetical protein